MNVGRSWRGKRRHSAHQLALAARFVLRNTIDQADTRMVLSSPALVVGYYPYTLCVSCFASELAAMIYMDKARKPASEDIRLRQGTLSN